MEKLAIFRMFLCFPLVGFLLPDIGIWLSRANEPIPVLHVIIETILAICIAGCTARMITLKKRFKNEANADENSALEI